MKKINTVACALAAVLTLGSCSDFLEVEPQNIITIDQFWNEESDVENMIAGCYSRMEEYDFISRMMIWGEFRSENIVTYSSTVDDDVNLEKLLQENITADNAYTNWTCFYNVINRCNVIIDYAPQVADNDPSYTKSELKAHIAEATALRSLCYFYLIRAFRDVPYNTESYLDDGQQLAIPASSFDVVLDSLINSLEAVADYAIETYPKASGLAGYYNTGRITKWCIYALLSEMYLWKQDYVNCIRYADLIIARKTKEAEDADPTADYSDFNDYPLIKSAWTLNGYYGKAFGSIFVDGNSMESIFELNFIKGSDGNKLSNGPVSNFYGNLGRSPYCNASEYVSSDISATTPKVFSNIYDGRGYENFYYDRNGNPLRINKYVSKGDVMITDPAKTESFFTTSEWSVAYETYGSDYASRNKSNYILYRLTDIMLLKAEAYTQLMSDNTELTDQDEAYRDSAFVLVDAVNKRSLYVSDVNDSKYASYLLDKSKYGSKTSITNLVYEERERELMFEGKRWFDLVRRARRDGNTKYMREFVPQKVTSLSSIIDNQLQKIDRIYWPYNLEELKVNTYLKQNSAFSSGENSSYEKSASK